MKRKRGLGSGWEDPASTRKQFRGCPDGKAHGAFPVSYSAYPCVAYITYSKGHRGWGWWGSQRLSSPCGPPRVACKPSLPHPPPGASVPQRTLRHVPSNSGCFYTRWGKCPSCCPAGTESSRTPCPGAGGLWPRQPTDLGDRKQQTVSGRSRSCMLEIWMTARLGSGRSPLWCAHCHLPAVPSRGGKTAGELTGIRFIKTLIPFTRAAPS